jgi:hypothetical protein
MFVALSAMARQNWADALASLGVRAVCLPYAQLARRKRGEVDDLLNTYKQAGAWVMLDSGAQSVSGDDADNLEDYLERYVRFVDRHKEQLDVWVEFDPIAYVQLDTIRAWRNRWKDAGLLDRLVVMFHGEDEILDGTYKHIGLTAGEADSYYSKFFRENLSALRDVGVRVYGRGVTRATVLQLPWFAVDSTTWTAWGRWGHIYFWNMAATRLEVFPQPEAGDADAKNQLRLREFERRNVWEEADKYNLSDDLRRLDGWAVDRWNALQWVQLQRHMETQVGNAYWLSDQEKRELVARRRESNRTALVVGGNTGTFAGDLTNSRQASPALQVGRYCDSCAVSDKCPVYRPGGECTLSQLRPIEGRDDVMAAVKDLLALQLDRVQFAAMVERLNGGFLTRDVSQNIQMFMGLLESLQKLTTPTAEVTVTAKGQGVISRVFGSLISNAREGVVERAATPVRTIDVVDIEPPIRTVRTAEPVPVEPGDKS